MIIFFVLSRPCVCVCVFWKQARVVDGIKPTFSVDSIGLSVLTRWMTAEYCGLQWGGRSGMFSCTGCA